MNCTLRKRFLSLFLYLLIGFSCSKDEAVIYELTTEVSPTSGGTVIPAKGSYDSGELVTISAIPEKGYVFKNWNGDILGNSNPFTFKIL
jgi:hypothetical protein